MESTDIFDRVFYARNALLRPVCQCDEITGHIRINRKLSKIHAQRFFVGYRSA